MLARKALLVDDSKSARFVLSKLLQKHDFEVEMVDSAEAALDFLVANRPDAIFMDHLMKGMDGLSATSKIKTDPATAHIPVVMCTSNDGEEYLREAMSHGALGTLIKPPSADKLEEILTAVEQAIGANHRATAPTTKDSLPEQSSVVNPEMDNVVNLPFNAGPSPTSHAPEAHQGGALGLELSDIEDSVAALVAQKLRKFEQTLDERFQQQQTQLQELLNARLDSFKQELALADLQTSLDNRLEVQSDLFEERIDELRRHLSNDILSSASVSKQVQEIARETASTVADETAKVAARNMGQRAARETFTPELEHAMENIRQEFSQVKRQASSKAGLFALLAAMSGVGAAVVVYFLAF
ncbi:MAG: response regulator [Gammaproteobacteria bacterium]|nr:response regulator [Gammaproteobacteria bacterium]